MPTDLPPPRDRVIQLMLELFRRGSLSTQQACRLLDASHKGDARLVRDDLKAIVRHGAAERHGSGRDTDYRVPHSHLDVHSGLLDRIALAFGREHTRFLESTLLGNPLSNDDVQPTFSARTSARHDQLFHFIHEPARSYAKHDEVLGDVVDALVRHRTLDLVYRKPTQHDTTLYESSQPLTLVVYRRSVSLLAHIPSKDGLRMFAVDRIVSVTEGSRFEYPTDWSPAQHFAHAFGLHTNGSPERVVLRFTPRAAPYVRARTWHPTQELRDLPNRGVELRMKVAGTELERWVLEWGQQCVVLEPQWLRDRVVAAHREALALYDLEPS